MPWTSKPTSPVLDTGHSLYSGLVEFFPFAELSGDAVGIKEGIALAPQNSADRVSTGYGLAGNCNASQKGFAVTAPSAVKINLPITLACVILPTGTLPSVSSVIFCVSANNSDSSPWLAYEAGWSSSAARLLRSSFNSGGTFNSTDLPGNSSNEYVDLSTSVPTTIVAALSTTERKLWINGVTVNTSSATRSSPTYSSTSTLGVGFYPAVSRNSEIKFLGGGIWSTYWGATEVASFNDDPFGVVRGSASASRLLSLRRRIAAGGLQ